MDKVRDIFLLFASGMAMLALLCAIYQAMHEKLASAALLATIFLVSALVVFIPRLELLEAWGVKARMVRTLDEAEQILAKLRQLSIVNAKATYRNIGVGNRIGTNSAVQNQIVLDDIDAHLKSMGVSEQERRALSSSYVELMGFDLYTIFSRTLERYFHSFSQDLSRRASKEPENAVLNADLIKWRDGLNTWKRNHQLFFQLGSYSLEDEVDKAAVADWLNELDKQGVRTFRNQIVKLFKDTQAKGGLTPEGAAYIDNYQDIGGQDKKIIELFGWNPSELR